MNNIKVLDCTLRDGGYVNNWEFSSPGIKKIIENLAKARVDFIECGFLKDLKEEYNKEKTLFNSINALEEIINSCENQNSKFCLMINFGDFPIEKIPNSNNKNILLRVAFKKDDRKDALEYCEVLKEKGYEIFINPMHTGSYTDVELSKLVENVNKIGPKAFTIVDTTGSMREKEVLNIFSLVNKELSQGISMAFHSHNNLQLSFSNAQSLIKICKERELIIDSAVFGMGRGAGNLCSELLIQYINDNYEGQYDIIPILKIIDEIISPVFARTPWGYSVPYYLAAVNHCHPNYAKYLVDKQSVPVEIINNLLKAIPLNNKSSFNPDLIKQIYLDNFSKTIDDTKTKNFIKNTIKNRPVLLLAPGKSIKLEKKKILDFIKEKNPFIISLNFIPKNYKEDLTVVTNLKRFSSLENTNTTLIVTSNIEKIPKNAFILNYSSYLNNSKMFDNAALIVLKLFIELNIKEIYAAGLDGFSQNVNENYFDNKLINTSKEDEIDRRNEIMTQALEEFQKEIKIHFITNSKYKRTI